MRARLGLSAVCLAAALAGCKGSTGPTGPEGATGPTGPSGPSGPAGASTGTASGTVRSAASGAPIPGATVTFSPTQATATAGADGAFARELPVGLHSARVDAAGFVGTTLAGVNVLAGEVTSLGDVRLQPVAPVLVASIAGARWQAGFGAPVTLTASVAGAPAGTSFSYAWKQVFQPGLSGPAPVDLTGADGPALSFTTASVADVAAAGLFEPRNRFGVLGITAADAESLSYVFEVVVTSPAGTTSARATVQMIAPHPGLNNVGVGVLTLLGAPADQTAYAWTCTVGGSPCAAGVLSGASTRNPTFVPDAVGTYTVAEASQAAPLTIQAALYVGVRSLEVETTCASCHEVTFVTGSGRTITSKASWDRTRHATFLQRALDGQLVPPAYDASCLVCHTGGFNPEASNDGFDDVAAELGWTLPAPGPGNWDALPEPLKARGGITCENCHGPGSQHAAGAFDTIGKSFASTDCNQCHAGVGRGIQGRQWLQSGHSRFTSGGTVPAPGDPALLPGCSACHSAQGFVAWMRRGALDTAPTVDAAEPQTCMACHDPHGETLVPPDGVVSPRLLRRYASVDTMDGYGVRGVGAGALCMTCHNGTEPFEQAFDPADLTGGQRAPHASTQTNVLIGKGAETFGQGGYPTSAHLGVPNTCVGCHMAPPSSPFILSGGHTVQLRVARGANENACTSCHGAEVIVDPLTDEFNRLAYGDYDGDGVLEGIQDEVGALVDPVAGEATGLVALLRAALAVRAAAIFDRAATEFVDGGATPTVVVAADPGAPGKLVRILKAFNDPAGTPECDPALAGGWPETCFAFPPHRIPADTAPRQTFLGAAWNLFYVANDGSRGVHNTAFAVSVLQRSYFELTGANVPGATLR